MISGFIRFLQSNGFSDIEAEAIAAKFTPRFLKKGESWVQEGETNNHLGFIEKGFLQYYVLIDGQEKTTYAAAANNFVVSLSSFLKQKPSQENIRAIMDSNLWIIHRKQLKELQDSLPNFQSFYIEILEWQICCIEESRLDALMLSAAERYQKMLRTEPELILQLPQQFLASILGVTPRHLSRIRNKSASADL